MPTAWPSELVVLSQFALVTAVYGAALALVQRDLRGFIGTLAMSQSALVLAGLVGQRCRWSSTAPSASGSRAAWRSPGIGLVDLGAREPGRAASRSRRCRGGSGTRPALAAFFLLFGMAGIGLPGTLSFVADDLIVSGSLDDQLDAGLMVIASTVLCGIAVMRVLVSRVRRAGGGRRPAARDPAPGAGAFTVLVGTLFALGIWPGPLVQALERAAEGILRRPANRCTNRSPPTPPRALRPAARRGGLPDDHVPSVFLPVPFPR